MRSSVFLVFNKRGVSRMAKNKPNLSGGEFACKIEINVSDKYFAQITPTARIDIDDKFVIEPKVELTPKLEEIKEVVTNEQI